MEPKWMAREEEGARFGRAQLHPGLSIAVSIPLPGSKNLTVNITHCTCYFYLCSGCINF